MFYRILMTALVAGAGAGAGVLVAGLQLVYTTPLILAAEVFETGAAGAVGATGATGAVGAPGVVESAMGLAPGWERNGLTVLASVLAAVGFGLILTGAMVLRAGPIDARTGALWGIAGFASVTLAPALGLSPELPGAGAAALADRQIWWLATVAASGVGLAVLVFVANRALKVAAIILISAPHIVGAPQPERYKSPVPAELAGHFASASLVLSAVLWIILGLLAGAVYRYLARRDTRLAPGSG